MQAPQMIGIPNSSSSRAPAQGRKITCDERALEAEGEPKAQEYLGGWSLSGSGGIYAAEEPPRAEEYLGWKGIWGGRIFRAEEYFGRKNILGGRIFGAEEYFGRKNILGRKNI